MYRPWFKLPPANLKLTLNGLNFFYTICTHVQKNEALHNVHVLCNFRAFNIPEKGKFRKWPLSV